MWLSFNDEDMSQIYVMYCDVLELGWRVKPDADVSSEMHGANSTTFDNNLHQHITRMCSSSNRHPFPVFSGDVYCQRLAKRSTASLYGRETPAPPAPCPAVTWVLGTRCIGTEPLETTTTPAACTLATSELRKSQRHMEDTWKTPIENWCFLMFLEIGMMDGFKHHSWYSPHFTVETWQKFLRNSSPGHSQLGISGLLSSPTWLAGYYVGNPGSSAFSKLRPPKL